MNVQDYISGPIHKNELVFNRPKSQQRINDLRDFQLNNPIKYAEQKAMYDASPLAKFIRDELWQFEFPKLK